ncbi:MAG: hypothetical protein NZ959_09890 [Armatimonadetes bacterium]|nr:hypothetical protein [Armatimonadota bacterium]MDW8122760.1 uroporphyrinogen decarboxylase family protein [Armatimonadota bacterium]
MTGRDRFMTALLRQGEPDRVPLWELIIDEPTLSAFGATCLEEFVEQEDLDAITIFEDMKLQPLTPTEEKELYWRGRPIITGTRQLVRDEWGIVWGITEEVQHPYPVEGPIKEPADIKHYTPPNPDDDHRLATLRSAVQRFKGKKAIVFLTHDVFEFSHYLRGGMENLLIDYIDRPSFVHELAEIVIDYKVRLMKRAIAEGADAIVAGDDYANAHGPVMSPEQFRQFILPYLAQSVQAAHDTNTPYIKHTDGNIWSLLPMMVEAGIDAIDPIEPAAGMDIGEVKRAYGDRLCLVGNVDCSFVLTFGTEEDVAEAVKETIAKASPNGGHILASSNSIHPGVLPRNYRVMVDTAKEFGRYPIDPELIQSYAHKNYISKYITIVSRR